MNVAQAFKVAGLTAVGSAVGILAAVLGIRLFGLHLVKPTSESAGDEPIMMAGGSMYISTSPNYPDDFMPSGNDLVHFSLTAGSAPAPSTGFVRKVEVYDSSDMSHPFTFDGSQQVLIDIDICRLNTTGDCRMGSNGGRETVEFQTSGTAAGVMNQGLKITSKVSGGSPVAPALMATALRLSDHLWRHPRLKKSIRSISVTGFTTGTALPSDLCKPDGDCSFKIHYCPTNFDCS